MVKYSILIPVYNAQDYIETCLNSVLCQKTTNYEVIMVNDGSQDHSAQICAAFAERDARFHLISQENRGTLEARKTAIAAAKGEYLLYLDSDDFWEPDTLETIDDLIQTWHPDILVFGMRKWYQENKQEEVPTAFESTKVFRGENKKEYVAAWLQKGWHNALWRKAIRRDCIDLTDPSYQVERMVMGEDMLLSVYAVHRADSILYTDRVLYNYRINDASTVHNFQPKYIQDIHIAFEAMYWMLQVDYPHESSLRKDFWVSYLESLIDCSASLFYETSLSKIKTWSDFIVSQTLFTDMVQSLTSFTTKQRLIITLLKCNLPALSKACAKIWFFFRK